MSKWRRRMGTAIVLGLLALALFTVLRPDPVRVDVATAARGALLVTVDEEGRTRVRDRFVIAAPIAGRLARIQLDPGDAVEQGRVVARLNPMPLDARERAAATARLEAAKASQQAAEARVEQARAELEQAQRDAERARALARQKTVSADERERAELAETARHQELDAALFAARAAAFEVEAARAVLMAPGSESAQTFVAACEAQQDGCLELRSPVHGRVLRRFEESERVVVAGTPLLEIGDPAALEVVVDVLSTDAVKVAPGAPMLIEEWGGGEALTARVRVVEPAGFTKLSALGVEEQRVNIIGDFDRPPAALGDAYRVEVRVVVWRADDVVKIPSSALFRHHGAWSVFVIEHDRARQRPVEIGHRTAAEAEVVTGLGPDTPVILHPSDQITDGVRVAPL